MKTTFLYLLKSINLLYGILLLCLLLHDSSANATEGDSTSGSLHLYFRLNYGFVIAHRPALAPLQENHVKGFEFTLTRPTTGEKIWESIFLYPEYGIAFVMLELGSPNRLGKGFALYPFIDFPLGKSRETRLYFRYGMGIGYVTNIFNRNDNYKNAAIGTHINEAVHFNLHVKSKLSERSGIEAGVGITHFSNGAFKLPNLGVNAATCNVAYRLAIGDKKPILLKAPLTMDKTPILLVRAGGFIKSIYPPLGKKYVAAVLSTTYLKPISYKSAWAAGADIFYDNSISARIDRLDGKSAKSIDNFRPGIYGGYHLNVNKIGLMFNMGYYLFNSWKEDGNIYHRICLNYYFEKLFVFSNIKSHYARADMFEIGMGYRFVKKKMPAAEK